LAYHVLSCSLRHVIDGESICEKIFTLAQSFMMHARRLLIHGKEWRMKQILQKSKSGLNVMPLGPRFNSDVLIPDSGIKRDCVAMWISEASCGLPSFRLDSTSKLMGYPCRGHRIETKKVWEVFYLFGFHYFFPNARNSRIAWLSVLSLCRLLCSRG
jgi:hypothetical protein